MVTLEKLGTDVDALTQKESEGVYCTFEDGSFSGFLSWKSLRMLLTMRQQQAEKKSEE
jgi:hypothetical protein